MVRRGWTTGAEKFVALVVVCLMVVVLVEERVGVVVVVVVIVVGSGTMKVIPGVVVEVHVACVGVVMSWTLMV